MTMAPPQRSTAATPLPPHYNQQQYSSKYPPPPHRIPPHISTSSNQQQQLCHQHNNNHLYQQQQSSIQHIPVTNSPICHRVPSPAPTFSSPVKDVCLLKINKKFGYFKLIFYSSWKIFSEPEKSFITPIFYFSALIF